MEQGLLGHQFELADVETIVRAVGELPEGRRKEDLLRDLEIVADKFFIAQTLNLNHTDKQRQKLLSRVEDAARNLVELLGELRGGSLETLLDERGHLMPPLERGRLPTSLLLQAALVEEKHPNEAEGAGRRANDALYEAFKGILLLQRWAAAARQYSPEVTETDLAPMDLGWLAEVKKPESWLIGKCLPELYADHFETSFKVSNPSMGGEPYGPGIRFVQACLAHWGIPRKPSAIVGAFRRYRKYGT